MSDVYTGDVIYRPGSIEGSWYSTLYRNGDELVHHRGYTRFGGRIWLWYEAKSWAAARKKRQSKDAKSIKGIRL